MKLTNPRCLAAVVILVVAGLFSSVMAADPTEEDQLPVVRKVVMRDARSVEALIKELETVQSSGLYQRRIQQGKTVITINLRFVAAGNVLLVVGEKKMVDEAIGPIRQMAYFFERPRAHLQLRLRVVQVTGPASNEVIQMTEAVRTLVEDQRREVVKSLADLQDYLRAQLKVPNGRTLRLVSSTTDLLPQLGTPDRPMTIPDMLLLLMLDRVAMLDGLDEQAPPVVDLAAEDQVDALSAVPLALRRLRSQPSLTDEEAEAQAAPLISLWLKRVQDIETELKRLEGQANKKKVPTSRLLPPPETRDTVLPQWMLIRLRRSLSMTQRLFPKLASKHASASLGALRLRFRDAHTRGERVAARLGQASGTRRQSDGLSIKDRLGAAGSKTLDQFQVLADSVVPTQMALFDAIAIDADGVAPTAKQVSQMFQEYTLERAKLEKELAGVKTATPVNYARLQSLEGSLNLWLRRVSESMARALEERHYSRYATDLRLLANRRLGRSSNRDLLQQADITELPDLTRDLLISGSRVNIFVSNSISLQFAPDTTNSVSTEVQASLPEQKPLSSRLAEATSAVSQLQTLQQVAGVDAKGILGAILAGGQPVPVRSGINLTATPSIGFDGGSVTLNLRASQTLEPQGAAVADRVTRHEISSATVSALSYEPMVLSTLTSNTSYYEEVGGVPLLRRVPLLKELLKDSPIKQLRPRKRQRGVYQASVIILEPVVIPTIEDLIRYHSGWVHSAGGPLKMQDLSPLFPGRVGEK